VRRSSLLGQTPNSLSSFDRWSRNIIRFRALEFTPLTENGSTAVGRHGTWIPVGEGFNVFGTTVHQRKKLLVFGRSTTVRIIQILL